MMNQREEDEHMQYEYRFQYSLASYCMTGSCQQPLIDSANHTPNTQQPQQQQQSTLQASQHILRRSSQLITFNCFLNPTTQHLIKTIFTHYINLYTPLAMRLLKISQLIFPNLNLSNSTFITRCQSHLDLHREKLVESIKDISRIFHNQREVFLRYLGLCVAAAVFKILMLEDEGGQVDFEAVFHTIMWELMGIHSTSQFLKKLLSQTFNPVNFHRYLMNEQPPKVHSFLKPGVVGGKSEMGKSMQNAHTSNSLGGAMNASMRNIQLFKTEKYLNEKSNMSFSKRLIKQDKENLPIKLNDNKNNKKEVEVKKDRDGLIENSSKGKITNRPFADYLSSTKKPTFASYLEQKRLQFDP